MSDLSRETGVFAGVHCANKTGNFTLRRCGDKEDGMLPMAVVDECPYCNSYHAMSAIGKDEHHCADCGKSFTAEDVREIAGTVKISRNDPFGRTQAMW